MANELSIVELRGLLRLRAKECYLWLKRHCPQEAIRRQGRCLYIAVWGVNYGLTRCKWQPRSPKGFQGCPGRTPPNLHFRDDLGRFVSHRTDRRPPKRQEYTAPQRRRYIKRTD